MGKMVDEDGESNVDPRMEEEMESIQPSFSLIQDFMVELFSQKAGSLVLSSGQGRREVTEQEDQLRGREDTVLLLLATVPSIFAFFAWEEVSHSLALFLDKYGAIGRAVDGGQFTVTLLRPTITGVVVPVISIALATLVSTTVNVLRARQVDLRALINKEACELRLLRRAVFGMFGTRQHASRRAKTLALLCGYVEQLERESNVGAVEALEELQLSGGISVNELDRIAEMLHGVDGAAASRQGVSLLKICLVVSTMLPVGAFSLLRYLVGCWCQSVGVADGLILSLTRHRSDRVALLLSVFPVIHWGVLVALSASICFTWLLNSNQQVLQYLNSIQLRTLFAILVGVFSGTATLCINLADPFRGTFSISESATQLGDLKLCLQQDVLEATKEEGEIRSKVVHALLLGGNFSGDDYTGYVAHKAGHLEPKRIASESLIPSGVTLSRQLSQKLTEKEDDGKSSIPTTVGYKKKDARRRYGLLSTIYFHLLTGPFGSNARALGDVVAWLATFVGSLTRIASRRIVNLSLGIRRRLPFGMTQREKHGKGNQAYSR
jgi:hypothetical protein